MLRDQAPIMPVEIAPGVYGYLAVTYRAVVYLLRNNPHRFAKDPKHWDALNHGQIPPDNPARAMMQPRDNALWKDGPEHARLRSAITESLARVDTHALAASVTQIADQLIDAFASAGQADLVTQYADPLPMQTVMDMFGCSHELSHRAISAVSRLFNAGEDAARANAELESACLELTDLKRRRPGRDVTTYLIAAGLNNAEMVQTILLLIGAAAPPTSSLIANAKRRILTNALLANNVHSGISSVAAAIDDVLWDNPPIHNYCPLYAQGHQIVEGVSLVPGWPILVSFAAANGDPSVLSMPGDRAGNRGHLAFSAGVHGCPAPTLARLIAETALERLLDRLPTIELSVTEQELTNRPGTFLAGLTALPVRFDPEAHPHHHGR
ncbi:cytochrome P450 [Streptomyces sp. NPDC020707]|uniref:cytochrome P450 n=1 Tax=Streptomyces sp. NPDC020707 TaxID=3365084 RepID=UPI0037A41F47